MNFNENLSLVRQSCYTLWDLFAYYSTGGQYSYLEGRYLPKRGVYVNWNRTQECYPKIFLTPSSLDEIIRIVKKSRKLRVVGAGHSFNSMICCDDTLISLDNLNKIILFDKEKKQIRIQSGMRLQNLLAFLEKENLTLPITGAYAAQSCAGVIATNVHGTGRDVGFISDSVMELKIIDGTGKLSILNKESPLFHATVGGIGLTGIIVEVLIQCVDMFYLKRTQTIFNRLDMLDRFLTYREECDPEKKFLTPLAEKLFLSDH